MTRPTDPFDANGQMDPGFLTPGEAGRMLGKLVGKSQNYTRAKVLNLFKRHGRPVYRTPLGSLVWHEDVLEVAKEDVAWWRREYGVGTLGVDPLCAGARERIRMGQYGEEPGPVGIPCPYCGMSVVVKAFVDAAGVLVGVLPNHRALSRAGARV